MLDFSQKLALDLNNSLKRYIRIVKSLLPLSLTNTELMSTEPFLSCGYRVQINTL